MRIVGAKVRFTRQADGGQGTRKAPGFYADRKANVVLEEDETFSTNVQRALDGAKARVCDDLNLPPNHELKPSK